MKPFPKSFTCGVSDSRPILCEDCGCMDHIPIYDKVQVDAWLTELRDIVIYRLSHPFVAEIGREILEALPTHVCIDNNTGKPKQQEIKKT